MERFNVDIRFPKDKDSGVVVIQGLEENVEDAKEHLVTLAEDYVSGYNGTSDKGPSEIGTTSLQRTLVASPC